MTRRPIRWGRDGSRAVSSVPGGGGVVRAERDLLVDAAQSLHLVLESSDAGLQLFVRLFQGHNVIGRSFQQRDLAALLVRNREDILQFRVAVSEFVSSTLLGLYPLPSSSLLAGVSKVFHCIRYAHVVVVV